MDKIVIHHGDCLTLLSNAEPVDIIVTSPPYNINMKYDVYNDKLSNSSYLEWIDKLAVSLYHVLKPNGSLFLNVMANSKNPWLVHDIGNRFRKYFRLQNEICWVKSITMNDETKGSFRPSISNRFLNRNHETILHFTVNGDVKIDRLAVGCKYVEQYNRTRNGRRMDDRRCAGNVWFIPYTKGGINKINTHPAAFPLELPLRCIKLHGFDSNTIVMDPFMGSGTTALAAKQLGLRFIGFEISKEYIEIAEKRLK